MKNEDIKILFYFLKTPRDRITDILYFNLVVLVKNVRKNILNSIIFEKFEDIYFLELIF